MSAIDFPSSPQTDQIHSDGVKAWRWNGSAWENFNLRIDSVQLLDIDYDGGDASSGGQAILKSSGTFYQQQFIARYV